MINIQKVLDDISWIGASDRRLALFENLFPLPQGVSYNSYVLSDEKIVLFDTADVSVADQYLENLEAALAGRTPDYLVILHMEPDHCALLRTVLQRYPSLTLVSSAKAFGLIDQFFPELSGMQQEGARLIIKEGDTLSTGKHTLRFIAAPMVHWPEVMLAYDETTKALFSADAFGTFGAIRGSIFADECDFEKNYLDDARRYYANIVGKYGQQVQAVLKKAAALDIQAILPLHGPVWRKNPGWLISKYQLWSTYTPETDDILVVYGSLYGHTAGAAQSFAALVQDKSGCPVSVHDVSVSHVSELISEVWRCRRIVLFCPTYNNGIYPAMHAFINDMAALGVQNRVFALAENGSWAPVAGKLMREQLMTFKNCQVLENTFSFKSALHAADEERLADFAQQVAGL